MNRSNFGVQNEYWTLGDLFVVAYWYNSFNSLLSICAECMPFQCRDAQKTIWLSLLLYAATMGWLAASFVQFIVCDDRMNVHKTYTVVNFPQ